MKMVMQPTTLPKLAIGKINEKPRAKQLNTDKLGYTNKMQDTEAQVQCHANNDGITSVNTNPMITENNNSKIHYSIPGPCQETERRVQAKQMQQLQKEFNDGTFSL